MFNLFRKKTPKQPDIIGEIVEKLMLPDTIGDKVFVGDDAPTVSDESGVLNIDELRYFARCNYRLTPQIQRELAKYWAISRACRMPVEDCLRNGYELIGKAQEQVPDSHIKTIATFNEEFKFSERLESVLYWSRVYGIRVCVFQFEGLTDDHYANPINWETLKSYKYKGFFALSPQYCVPTEFEFNDPMRFREVNYWRVANRKYHHTWTRIVHHSEVDADLLPQYMGGSVSLVDEIHEKVFQADQAANESLQILFTKNLQVQKGDTELAMLDQAGFEAKMTFFSRLSGQFRKLFLGRDETYENVEKSLQGVEDLFARYYSIVAAVAKVPVNRFMMNNETSGMFNSGEAEDRIYNESNLSTLQVKINPVIEFHNKAILITNGLDHENIAIQWNKCGALTQAELADIQSKRIANDVQLVQAQIIPPDKAAERISKDKGSGYAGIDLTQPEPSDDPLAGLDFSMFAPQQQIEQQQPIDAIKNIHDEFGGQKSVAMMQEYLKSQGKQPVHVQDSKGWIGVDLDGTLAVYNGWKGIEYIGEPIQQMIDRVKEWIESGQQVKIFTARASDENAIPYIKQWLKNNGLPELEITNIKDFGMIQLWDDRAIQVAQNTGKPIESTTQTKDERPLQSEYTIDEKLQRLKDRRDPDSLESFSDVFIPVFDKQFHSNDKPQAGDIITIDGYDVLIENPAGSVRAWTDSTGRTGDSVMTCHYGELQGYSGADDDYLDIFIVE